MILHTYYRSSASYRVRIALNLKQLKAEQAYVHLNRNGGEQFGDAFHAVNPAHLLPVLEDDGLRLTQSLAIMEYLDETYGGHALLPSDTAGKARVRALSQAIACDIHPINNLRVLKYLEGTLGVSPEQKTAWVRHWIALGLAALEEQLARDRATGLFCHGDTPTMADCVLVPQIFNAKRFDCRLDHVPNVMRVFDECMKLPAFSETQPSKCPDFEG
jgi:maleylacetoacetate isomerase/maleylpyruvate isomerase